VPDTAAPPAPPAPPSVSRSIRGLIRASEAVDALLGRIQFELADGFLPQRDELADVLRFDMPIGEDGTPNSIAARIKDFIYEDILILRQWDTMQQTFRAMTLALAQLEDALVELRRAVTWSSRFAGFNWWLLKRQEQMEVSQFLLIAGPGSCRDFHIERASSVAKAFEQANLYLKLPPEKLEALQHVRILTVPQSDGASAKWHPISLGHELAHLRYDMDWILSWLASQQPSSDSAAEEVVAIAARWSTRKILTMERWFENLCSWLVETSCDAAMLRFYGPRSVDALGTYLSVHSVKGDGIAHPAPEPRLATLAATSTDDLAEFKIQPGDDEVLTRQRKNAYCDLAVTVRDAVLAELGSTEEDDKRRRTVEKLALKSMSNDETPCANDWNVDWVCDHPDNVEAGLVGSLWAADADDITDEPPDTAQLALDERRIEHAVDFLQFLHRFETRSRMDLKVKQPEPTDRPTNVLFVTTGGISRKSLRERKPGVAAHDVRLGRHFIVFRRNQIATLNALDVDRESRQIQEAVEIGWGDTFVLHPSEMVLAVTLESMVMSNDCTAQVLSRSSLGRMGLLSATAVQVQPGFRGCLTLELVNLASVPLMLSPGQRVAQLIPTHAVGQSLHYSGKYQNQNWKPQFSAVVNDWEMPILKALNKDARRAGEAIDGDDQG
jgi:deoxycytidine triphosphate deaminase